MCLGGASFVNNCKQICETESRLSCVRHSGIGRCRLLKKEKEKKKLILQGGFAMKQSEVAG